MNIATNRMNQLALVVGQIVPLHTAISVELQPKEKHVIQFQPRNKPNGNDIYYRHKSHS